MRETALKTLKATRRVSGAIICGIVALAGQAALAHPGGEEVHSGLGLAHQLAWHDGLLAVLAAGLLVWIAARRLRRNAEREPRR